MKKVLVTYATLSGTTAEVAEAVCAEIAKAGLPVEVLPLAAVKSLDGYGAVVLGAPMIAGWHRSALGFLGRHRRDLAHMPVALFAMAMSLTQTTLTTVDAVPLAIDPELPKPPRQPGKLSFRERYAQAEHYVRPMLNAVRPARPVSVALLGGRLEYGRLPWWAVVFAMLVIQAPAGDKHNWPFIKSWAAGLPAVFERAAASH